MSLVPLAPWIADLDSRLPIVFRVHMVSASLAVPVLSLALLSSRDPRRHRWLGRVAAVLVLVASGTAIPAALASTADGLARAGFLAQAITWAVTLMWGGAAIVQGRRLEHRRAMIAMAAVGFGALMLRPMIVAVGAAGLDVGTHYALIVWAAWVVPLAVVTLTTRANRARCPPAVGRSAAGPA